MGKDVDEGCVPPEAICPGKRPKTAVSPGAGTKKILGQSLESPSSARGGAFAAKSLSPDDVVIIFGKHRCQSSPGRSVCARSLVCTFPQLRSSRMALQPGPASGRACYPEVGPARGARGPRPSWFSNPGCPSRRVRGFASMTWIRSSDGIPSP